MDMETLLTKLAQARTAEAQATTDRLKIEQEIIELGGVYDGKLDVTVGIIDRKKTKMSDHGDDYYTKMVLGKIKQAGRGGITKRELTRTTQSINGHERNDILSTLMYSEKVVKDMRPGRTKWTTVYTYNPN